MPPRINEHGQPIGHSLAGWTPCAAPDRTAMEGRYCAVVALDARNHAHDLFAAFREDGDGALWTYNLIGPFGTERAFRDWAEAAGADVTQPYFAIIDKATGKASGIASYMRIKPPHGVIEVGGITYAPRLQRTPAATEAMYLMMRRVFDELGYRRYEWKCDALNAPSCRAAERLGFTYDGTFRQAVVYKGRNRDTAWFSILDQDWPPIEQAFEAWLDPGNFDETGAQRRKLADLIGEMRSAPA